MRNTIRDVFQTIFIKRISLEVYYWNHILGPFAKDFLYW